MGFFQSCPQPEGWGAHFSGWSLKKRSNVRRERAARDRVDPDIEGAKQTAHLKGVHQIRLSINLKDDFGGVCMEGFTAQAKPLAMALCPRQEGRTLQFAAHGEGLGLV